MMKKYRSISGIVMTSHIGQSFVSSGGELD